MIVVSLLLFLAGVALLVAGLVAQSISLEVASIVSALLSALVLYLGVRQRPPVGQPLPSDGLEPGLLGQVEPADRGAAERSHPGRANAAAGGSGATALVSERPERETGSGATAFAPAAEVPGSEVPGSEVSGADEVVPELADQGVPTLAGQAVPAEPTGLSQLMDGPEQPAEQAPPPAMALTRQYPDEPDEEPVRAADVEWIAAQPDIVQVVDGHPRYHVGPCPSLRDQEIFAMPVSEARESGFTPCGRCRPDATILDSAWRAHLNRGGH